MSKILTQIILIHYTQIFQNFSSYLIPVLFGGEIKHRLGTKCLTRKMIIDVQTHIYIQNPLISKFSLYLITIHDKM